MQLSIFDVIGPIMIGPSSSHTAGAAKLGRVSASIAEKPFHKVDFGLAGSFAKTGWGHGTDKALIAGILGFQSDDPRIVNAEEYAKAANIEISFHEESLEWLHENGVHSTFFHDDGTTTQVYGASTGGGRIRIHKIDQFLTEFCAEVPTLIFFHQDVPGMIRDITSVLATHQINIGVMRLLRESKGELANTVVEIDSKITPELVDELQNLKHVKKVVFVNV